MSEVKDCVSCVHEYLSPMSDTCRECGIAMLNYEEAKPKPITNADRIRAMSVEEMAEFLTPVKCVDCHILDCGVGEIGDNRTCEQRIRDWLKQEVSTNG